MGTANRFLSPFKFALGEEGGEIGSILIMSIVLGILVVPTVVYGQRPESDLDAVNIVTGINVSVRLLAAVTLVVAFTAIRYNMQEWVNDKSSNMIIKTKLAFALRMCNTGSECNADECCVSNNPPCGRRFLDTHSHLGHCVPMGTDGSSKSEIYCTNSTTMIFYCSLKWHNRMKTASGFLSPVECARGEEVGEIGSILIMSIVLGILVVPTVVYGQRPESDIDAVNIVTGINVTVRLLAAVTLVVAFSAIRNNMQEWVNDKSSNMIIKTKLVFIWIFGFAKMQLTATITNAVFLTSDRLGKGRRVSMVTALHYEKLETVIEEY
uniref:Uncharacterized protein n=1 Tax=Magallana gigas TaxID=29159 RepID=K1PX74_MAGGI